MSEIILPEPPPPPPPPPPQQPEAAPPGDDRLFAWYVDGRDARWQRVEVGLKAPAGHSVPDRLRLTLPDGARVEWPLADLRALRDQAGARDSILLKRAGRDPARLMLRGAGVVAHIRGLAPNLARREPATGIGRLVKWGVAAVASVTLIIFGLVPIMAAQLATLLPPEGEKALGDATLAQIRSAMATTGMEVLPTCSTPEGDAALAAMRARLNAEGDLPYPLEVHVFDHEMVNAFALPGGHVVLFRGLIDAAEDPDEVAAVLAHEIGHVANRDPTRDALRSAGAIGVLGLLFGDFAGGTVVLFLTNQLINASYSQAAETKADAFAHEVLHEAGISPAALGRMFERLREKHGDAEGIIAHLASHPTMRERIDAALEAEAAGPVEGAAPVISGAEWRALQRICGAKPIEQRLEDAADDIADRLGAPRSGNGSGNDGGKGGKGQVTGPPSGGSAGNGAESGKK